MTAKTYEEIAVGDAAAFEVVVDGALVAKFAAVSGDENPLHVDASYAATTPFGKPIAHGMLVEALFSRLIGMHLPGRYALYLSQTLRFHEPIPLGTTVRIRGEVTHKTDAHQTLAVRTTAEDAVSGKVLVSGEAMVAVLHPHDI